MNKALGLRSTRLALLGLAMVLPLAGCSHVDRAVATSPVPEDFHARHQVVLTNASQALDVFMVGYANRLDERQSRDVQAFAADYMAHGHGRIRVQMPAGPVDGRAAQATLAAVRSTLSRAGVRGDVEVGSYPVSDPRLASVVRLSFTALKTGLASRCGDWPDDLASGSTIDGWSNRSWYDFGCSTQKTLAAQIDDPRDLVRPRAEDPSDVQMRTRAIQDIRGAPGAAQGTDPSTAWGATRPIVN